MSCDDSIVSVLSADGYDEDEIGDIFARHMELIGADSLLRSGMRVVIKPNLLRKSSPDDGVTTHPFFVTAAARWLAGKGISDIILADSPGGPYSKSALDAVYKSCGMDTAAERAGIHLNRETGYRSMQSEKARVCRSFSVIDPIAGADLIINLPRLKTHGMMMLSGAVKNLFGAIPGLQKPELHFRFSNKGDFAGMLCDLALTLPPTITVVDAIVSMEGDGPAAGTLRETGQTFASLDPFALDYALCEFAGMLPEAVYTVRDAVERKLVYPDSITYPGEGKPPSVEDFILPASWPLGFEGNVHPFLRGVVKLLGEKVLAPSPVIEKKLCIGCGKCVESCAPKAVTVKKRKAVIRYSKCIRCFCCHEMCPVKAIDIKRPKIFKL